MKKYNTRKKYIVLAFIFLGIIISSLVGAADLINWANIRNHSVGRYFYIDNSTLNNTLRLNETELNATIDARNIDTTCNNTSCNISNTGTLDGYEAEDFLNHIPEKINSSTGYGSVYFEGSQNSTVVLDGYPAGGQNDYVVKFKYHGSDFGGITGNGALTVGDPQVSVVKSTDSVVWTGEHTYVNPLTLYRINDPTHPTSALNRTIWYSWYDTNLSQTWPYVRSSNGDIIRLEGTIINESSNHSSATLDGQPETITENWEFNAGLTTNSISSEDGTGDMTNTPQSDAGGTPHGAPATNWTKFVWDSGQVGSGGDLFEFNYEYYYEDDGWWDDGDTIRGYIEEQGDGAYVSMVQSGGFITGYWGGYYQFYGGDDYFKRNRIKSTTGQYYIDVSSGFNVLVNDYGSALNFKVKGNDVFVINKGGAANPTKIYSSGIIRPFVGDSLSIGGTSSGEAIDQIVLEGAFKWGNYGNEGNIVMNDTNTMNMTEGNLNIENNLTVEGVKVATINDVNTCTPIPVYFTCGENSALDNNAAEWSCGGNGETTQYVYTWDNITAKGMALDCNSGSGTAVVRLETQSGGATGCQITSTTTNDATTCNQNISASSWFRPFTVSDTGHSNCVVTMRFETTC